MHQNEPVNWHREVTIMTRTRSGFETFSLGIAMGYSNK
jgi:hypothetical protein